MSNETDIVNFSSLRELRARSKRFYQMRRYKYLDTETTESNKQDDTIAELIRKAESNDQEKETIKDNLIRLKAEFDNYRKRVDRDKKDTIERAGEDILRDLIMTIDQFDLALKASANLPPDDSFLQGVKMIYDGLITLLENKGLKKINALGEMFDPHFHEAVAVEPAEDKKDNTITLVLREGYAFKSKVLRPAMVKVVKNS